MFAAVEARKLAGEMVPLDAAAPGEGKLGFTLRVPIGVVGAISPFNFPLNLVAHKVAPAIAAGCPVVLKPASQTPFSAITLAQMLLHECGLPLGHLNVVTGGGSTVGNALVDDPDIALITFTGSPEVGWGIKARAPRKKVGLELGNNAPVIIESDANWESAADKIRVAGFSHAGQSCISTQRIYVQRALVDDFTAGLAERVRTLVVGDPLDEATEVSALISTGERDRVTAWIDEAAAGGAKVVVGGEVGADGVLGPTVLVGREARHEGVPEGGVRPGRRRSRPTTTSTRRSRSRTTPSTACRPRSSPPTSARRSRRPARSTSAACSSTRCPTWRADQMPYGGVRDSGNTREGPAYSVREMTETRLIVITA